MSVWVYQFVDCIRACVSFNVKHQEILNSGGSNESCTGISYAPSIMYGDLSADHVAGNCFLKAVFPISAGGSDGVDSAFYANLGVP